MHSVMMLYTDLQHEVQKMIDKFREECEHPDANVLKVLDASTGNYDPSSNAYWANLKCYLCGTTWKADSEDNDEDYRFRGQVVTNFPDACKHWSGPTEMIDPCTWNASENNFWCSACDKRWTIELRVY